MDPRFVGKDVITDFISLFESFPCLWKIKSKEYLNKNLRTEAYKELIRFCKSHYPDANLKFVKTKIQSFRNGFRKEMRKVEMSKRSGAGVDNIYEPSLWYYKLLMFTKDQELPEKSTENVKQDPGEESSIDAEEESSQIEEREPNCSAANPELQRKKTSTAPKAIKELKKRKQTMEEQFFNTCITALNREDKDDEYDLVGKNVAVKLRKMNFHQRVVAESLIQQVITRGLFNELTRDTSLEERSYSSNYTTLASTSTSHPSTPALSLFDQ